MHPSIRPLLCVCAFVCDSRTAGMKFDWHAFWRWQNPQRFLSLAATKMTKINLYSSTFISSVHSQNDGFVFAPFVLSHFAIHSIWCHCHRFMGCIVVRRTIKLWLCVVAAIISQPNIYDLFNVCFMIFSSNSRIHVYTTFCGIQTHHATSIASTYV